MGTLGEEMEVNNEVLIEIGSERST